VRKKPRVGTKPEDWQQFAVFEDEASAEALAGRLRVDGVPAQVAGRSLVPGLNEGFQVMVPTRLAHRAKRVAALAELTDEELRYLATGESPGDDGSGAGR
jgi:hypothetical protein